MSRAESIRPRQRSGQTGPSRSIAARSRRAWRIRAQEADAHLRSPGRSGAPSHPRTARCGGNGIWGSGRGDRGRVRDHAGGSVAAPQGAARERLCTGPAGGAKTTLFRGCCGASGGGCVDRSVQGLLGAEVGRAGDGDRARQTRAPSRINGQTDWEEGLDRARKKNGGGIMSSAKTIRDVMRELAALEEPKMREASERRGDDHGVNLTHLRALAKRLKTQHDLALQLWATGDTAGRLLATLVCRPKAFSVAELDPMTRDIA